MELSPLDSQRLRQALELAEGSFGLTEPNPRVGCIIGWPNGEIIGSGATQEAGSAHAEVMALRDAQARGLPTRGATVWVTLEPCAHHGRTPPCCEALVQAEVGRVVIGLLDPFPAVNGAGVARLRSAGIQVDVAEGALAIESACVNPGFLSRVLRGKPWVRLKIAASLDARTALPNGRSQWITGEEARRDGHQFRRRASAVLTGIGTVLADDPRMDVRWFDTPRQPMRVVVDSQFRLPLQSRILAPPGDVCVFGAVNTSQADASLAGAARLFSRPGSHGQVDLDGMLQSLAELGCNEVHVEAGARLNGALLKGNWVDEVLMYTAPILLGPGHPMADLPEIHQLSDAAQLHFKDFKHIGTDLRIRSLTNRGRRLVEERC